jgi:hypothetical protein
MSSRVCSSFQVFISLYFKPSIGLYLLARRSPDKQGPDDKPATSFSTTSKTTSVQTAEVFLFFSVEMKTMS